MAISFQARNQRPVPSRFLAWMRKKVPYTTESSLCDAIKCGAPEVTRFSLVSDPTSFSATNIKGANEATLSWSAPSTLPKNGIYKISRASADVGQPFGPYSEVTRLKSLTDTSYKNSGLGYNKDYRYKFQICDASGNNCTAGKLSDRVTVGTDTSKKPSVSVNPGADRAIITLSGAKSNQQYQVVVKDKDGNIVSSKKSATSPITVSGLDAKKGPYTTESSLCDTIKCGAPEVTRFSLVSDPTSFSATNIKGANEATLSWSAPSTLPKNGIYKISRASADVGQPFGPYSEVTRLKSLTDTSYKNSGLGYNKDYRYKFQICDASGNNCTAGKLSDRVTVGTNLSGKPVVQVNPGADRAIITLSGAKSNQQYQVVVKDKDGNIVSSKKSETSPITVSGLDAKKGPYTTESSLCDTIKCGSPEVTRFSLVSDPTSFSATNIKGANEATLSWSAPSTLPKNGIYKISRASADVGQPFGSYDKVTERPLTDTSYKNSGLGYNKDYRYKLQICDASGNNCTSGKLSNRVTVGTDTSKKPSVSVNPGADRAIITLSGAKSNQQYQVVVKDKDGNIVSSKKSETSPITVSGLDAKKGPYTTESSLCDTIKCGSPEVTRFSLVSDPTSFSATNIKGANEATLSWSTPSTLPTKGIYKISRASANVGQYFGPYSEVTRLKSLTDTSYQDSGLGYNKDYRYKFQVCDASGNNCTSGKLSNRVTVGTDTSKKPSVSVNPGADRAIITLSGAKPNQQYQVVVKDKDGNIVSSKKSATSPITVSGLDVKNGPYTAESSLCDAIKCGAPDVRTFNVLGYAKPKVPTLNVTPNNRGARFVISGADASKGGKYRLEIRDKNGRLYTNSVPMDSMGKGEIVLSFVTQFNPYTTKAYNCNKSGTCVASAEQTFNVLGGELSDVSQFSGIRVSNNSATLTWSKASYLPQGGGYRLTRMSAARNPYSVFIPGNSVLSYTDMGLDTYADYLYTLRVCRDDTASSCSKGKSVRLNVIEKELSDVSQFNGIRVSNNLATLTWSKASYLPQGGGYQLTRMAAARYPYSVFIPGNGVLSYTDKGLETADYLYTLRVCTDSTASKCTKGKSVRLNTVTPATPTLVVKPNDRSARFLISGANVSKGDKYRLDVRDKNGRLYTIPVSVDAMGKGEIVLSYVTQLNPYKAKAYNCNKSGTCVASAEQTFNVLGRDLSVAKTEDSNNKTAQALRTIKVNDTGVTWRGLAPIGGTASSVGSICNDEGSLSGQDCSTGRDAESSAGILSKQGSGVSGFDFSKLDESGKTLPSTASSWSCVRDNVTGLVWEAKTSDKGLHSSQWKYSWYGLDNHSKSRGTLGSSPDGKNCGSGSGAPSSCDTHNYVDKVNSQGYCGISNWRLPKTEELRSIALIGNSSSSIDANFFPNTASGSYWTSSLWQPNNIKTVSFTLDGHSGVSKFTDSVEPAHIRLVSSSSNAKTPIADSSLKNFEIFDGGASVKDVHTGLIWSRCLVGTKLDNGGTPSNYKDDICVGTSSLLDWQTALNSGDDESGWRVPNVKELGSILDSQSQISSALDTRVFPVVSDVSDLDKLILWTSTPSLKRTGSKLSEQNSTSSWSFSSYYGLESQDLRSKRNRVLLVR